MASALRTASCSDSVSGTRAAPQDDKALVQVFQALLNLGILLPQRAQRLCVLLAHGGNRRQKSAAIAQRRIAGRTAVVSRPDPDAIDERLDAGEMGFPLLVRLSLAESGPKGFALAPDAELRALPRSRDPESAERRVAGRARYPRHPLGAPDSLANACACPQAGRERHPLQPLPSRRASRNLVADRPPSHRKSPSSTTLWRVIAGDHRPVGVHLPGASRTRSPCSKRNGSDGIVNAQAHRLGYAPPRAVHAPLLCALPFRVCDPPRSVELQARQHGLELGLGLVRRAFGESQQLFGQLRVTTK